MKITLKFCYTLAKSKNQVDKDGQHWNQLNRKDLADNSTEKILSALFSSFFMQLWHSIQPDRLKHPLKASEDLKLPDLDIFIYLYTSRPFYQNPPKRRLKSPLIRWNVSQNEEATRRGFVTVKISVLAYHWFLRMQVCRPVSELIFFFWLNCAWWQSVSVFPCLYS